MRTIPDDADKDGEYATSTAFADWKDAPGVVLDAVDDLLEAHGLEIVLLDTGSDTYAFRVAAKTEATP